MCGVRLEVDVHIVTGAVSSAANITKSCSKAGIAVEDIYLEQLASSEAVLTDEEREIGVCLIDGGGGTTDMAVFNRGACYHTAVLQIGGNNFTRDSMPLKFDIPPVITTPAGSISINFLFLISPKNSSHISSALNCNI